MISLQSVRRALPLMKITLGAADWETCARFAQESVSTHSTHYAKRNQSNAPKIQEQIRVGKLAEFGVHRLLAGDCR